MADAASSNQHSVTTEELLAAAGIEVTEEGKARARRRLDEAEKRMTPDFWAALRAQVGFPPADAA